MRPAFRAPLVFLGLLAVASCADLTVYETPYAQGGVSDAESGAPIPLASISVDGRSDVVTSSNQDGGFVLRSATHKERFPAFLPMDSFSPGGQIVVRAAGYDARVVPLRSGVNVVRISLFRSLPATSEDPDARLPLYVKSSDYEFEEHFFSSAEELESYLQQRRPRRLRVVPLPESTYRQVSGAVKAIQHVGGIDFGLVGNGAEK